MRKELSDQQEDTVRIIGNKNSKYIIYTADGTEFYLDEFNEFRPEGKIGNDIIKFHPENIIAVRTRQVPT